MSYLHEWHMHRHNFLGPQPLGPWGRVKNLIFWTWSCSISNLRGWAVDQDTLINFNLWSNWWPWDGVKGSITIRFLQEHGDLRWRAIECVLVTFMSILNFMLSWVEYEESFLTLGVWSKAFLVYYSDKSFFFCSSYLWSWALFFVSSWCVIWL